MDESQGKRTDGAGNEISRSGTSNVSFHKASGRKFQQTSDPFLTKHQKFCPHISSKTIKSALCKVINSFSLQKAVKGVSGEEILFAVKETSNKKAIWNKEKMSAKKNKVGIQQSSCESDMEIEFENDDCDDDISDGDGECLFFTGLFSQDKHGEKWAECVRCSRWAHEDCGVEEDYFVCPMCRKSVKWQVRS